jgi:hypothetical protein
MGSTTHEDSRTPRPLLAFSRIRVLTTVYSLFDGTHTEPTLVPTKARPLERGDYEVQFRTMTLTHPYNDTILNTEWMIALDPSQGWIGKSVISWNQSRGTAWEALDDRGTVQPQKT